MAKSTAVMLAETLGWDYKEVKDYRYQRYTAPAVYSIGDRYFAVHPTAPKHSDVSANPWREHTDQFGVRGTDYKIWVCEAS